MCSRGTDRYPSFREAGDDAAQPLSRQPQRSLVKRFVAIHRSRAKLLPLALGIRNRNVPPRRVDLVGVGAAKNVPTETIDRGEIAMAVRSSRSALGICRRPDRCLDYGCCLGCAE